MEKPKNFEETLKWLNELEGTNAQFRRDLDIVTANFAQAIVDAQNQHSAAPEAKIARSAIFNSAIFKSAIFKGEIRLIVGPMFSGKTTELLRRYRRQTLGKQPCLLIQFEGDTRYLSTEEQKQHLVATHDGTKIPASLIGKQLANLVQNLLPPLTIFINEGQFFPDVFETVLQLTQKGIHVEIAALNLDKDQIPFDGIWKLMPRAHKIDVLTAICQQCHTAEAIYTQKTGGSSEQRVDIGGPEKYRAVCALCFGGSAPKTPSASAPVAPLVLGSGGSAIALPPVALSPGVVVQNHA